MWSLESMCKQKTLISEQNRLVFFSVLVICGNPLLVIVTYHTRRQSKNLSWGWISATSSIHTDSLNSNGIGGLWIQASNSVISPSWVDVPDVSETTKEWKERIGVCFKESYGEALDDVTSSALSLIPFNGNAVLLNFEHRWPARWWRRGWKQKLHTNVNIKFILLAINHNNIIISTSKLNA